MGGINEVKNIKEVKKPVSEMTEEEKEAEKQKVLKTVGDNVNKGGRFTKTIHLEFEDFKGDITFHRPTIGEEREIGIRYNRYKQETMVDIVTDNVCLFLATFDVVIDVSPDWWKPHELYDYELIEFVWEEYAEWRNSFRRFRNPRHKDDSKTAEAEKALVDTERVQSSANK